MSASIIASELKKRNVPDVLTALNGEKVTTKEGWEQAQRSYWLKLLLEKEYGRIPPRVQPKMEAVTSPIDLAFI